MPSISRLVQKFVVAGLCLAAVGAFIVLQPRLERERPRAPVVAPPAEFEPQVVSRRHTVVLPMYAWAYYLVAEYADSKTERALAAASAIHLDPGSVRQSSLSKAVVDEASRILRVQGAPYLKARHTSSNTEI